MRKYVSTKHIFRYPSSVSCQPAFFLTMFAFKPLFVIFFFLCLCFNSKHLPGPSSLGRAAHIYLYNLSEEFKISVSVLFSSALGEMLGIEKKNILKTTKNLRFVCQKYLPPPYMHLKKSLFLEKTKKKKSNMIFFLLFNMVLDLNISIQSLMVLICLPLKNISTDNLKI